jgi:uncharacterized protein (TIGR02246 family)
MALQRLVIVAASALFIAHTQQDVAKEVEGAVQTILTAYSKGDVDTVKRLMTEDHLAILPYAYFSNAADQLKNLSEWKIAAYNVDGLKVKILTGDVALVSYQATIKATYRGKEVPSPVRVSEVWVKRDGRWVQASYQETAAGGK